MKFPVWQLAFLCLFFYSFNLFSSTTDVYSLLSIDKATLSREQSGKFARLCVDYNGRICPLQTLAMDFTTKLVGKPKYKYANAEQVFLGWIFFPDKWQHVPFFDIKSPEMKALINSSGKACFADFFNQDKSYKLTRYQQQMYSSDKQSGFIKEALKLDEKIQLIAMLQSGGLLRMFPVQMQDSNIRWLSPVDSFPETVSKQDVLIAQNFFSLYYECIKTGNVEEASVILDKLAIYQQNNAYGTLPSQTHLKAELLYNKVNIFSLLFKVNLLLGCLGLFFFIFSLVKKNEIKKVCEFFYFLLIISFVFQILGLALRAYIAGRIPMSNGYETMLFIAWCALLIGVLGRRYSFLIVCFSFLLSGFTLLVAHIGSMNPQITSLVPVLQSPLLSIHVSFIMISYGLCGFMFLNSVASFVLKAFAPHAAETDSSVLMMKELSELFMFPAAFFMGIGIFIGAIWANVSWGRYWGWDPKEVWALITFILMSFSFHGKTIRWFNKPLVYHIFILLIFASVLMTYFGVNYILGGKHSYGGG